MEQTAAPLAMLIAYADVLDWICAEYRSVWRRIVVISRRCDKELISRYLIRCDVSCQHYTQ